MEKNINLKGWRERYRVEILFEYTNEKEVISIISKSLFMIGAGEILNSRHKTWNKFNSHLLGRKLTKEEIESKLLTLIPQLFNGLFTYLDNLNKLGIPRDKSAEDMKNILHNGRMFDSCRLLIPLALNSYQIEKLDKNKIIKELSKDDRLKVAVSYLLCIPNWKINQLNELIYKILE